MNKNNLIILLLFLLIAFNGTFFLNSCGGCISGCSTEDLDTDIDTGIEDIAEPDYYEKTATVTGQFDVDEVAELIPPTVPVPDNVTVSAIVTRSDLLTRTDLLGRSDLIGRSDFLKSSYKFQTDSSITALTEDGSFSLTVPVGYEFITMVEYGDELLGLIEYKNGDDLVSKITLKDTTSAYYKELKKESINEISAGNIRMGENGNFFNDVDFAPHLDAEKMASQESGDTALEILINDAAFTSSLYKVTIYAGGTENTEFKVNESNVIFTASISNVGFCDFTDNKDGTADLSCAPNEDDVGNYVVSVKSATDTKSKTISILVKIKTSSSGEEDSEEDNSEDDDGGGKAEACSIAYGSSNNKNVAIGNSHTCAITQGAVKCWGQNLFGQLGLGNIFPANLPTTVDLGKIGVSVTSVSAGLAHTCALFSDGCVKCWGGNIYGQLGYGDTTLRGAGGVGGEMGDTLPCIDIDSTQAVKAISTGYNHTCALLQDGSLKCWGDNQYYQLGQLDSDNRGDGPSEMGSNLAKIDFTEPNRNVGKIATGANHTCVLVDYTTYYGEIYCWGLNDKGQLGLGDTSNQIVTPNESNSTSVGSNLSLSSITAGNSFTCALANDCTAKCWGDNQYGQLGLGDTTNRGGDGATMPANLPFIDVDGSIIDLKIGSTAQHICALLNGGDIKCWGLGSSGQLGSGSTSTIGDGSGEMGTNLSSVDTGGTSVDDVFSGGSHSCAILNDDSILKCWGQNLYGQLGVGNTSDLGNEANEMGTNLPTVLNLK